MTTEIIYIMIETDIGKKVVESRDYQQIAFNNYMNTNQKEEIKYGEKTERKFSIKPFISTKYGLSGEYLDIFCFVCESGKMYLISRNFKKLSGLCGYINRVIEYC
jgi:hypothetical protein